MEFHITLSSHVDRDNVRWWTSSIEFMDLEGRDRFVRSDLWISRTPSGATELAGKWIEENEKTGWDI